VPPPPPPPPPPPLPRPFTPSPPRKRRPWPFAGRSLAEALAHTAPPLVSTHSTAAAREYPGTTSYERQLWVVLDSLRLTYKEPPPPAHEKQVGRACGYSEYSRVPTCGAGAAEPAEDRARPLRRAARRARRDRQARAESWRRNPPVVGPLRPPGLGAGSGRWAAGVWVGAGRTALH
jgi:hypothetical protein